MSLWAYLAVRASRLGVLAAETALNSFSGLSPQPSMMIKAKVFFLSIVKDVSCSVDLLLCNMTEKPTELNTIFRQVPAVDFIRN